MHRSEFAFSSELAKPCNNTPTIKESFLAPKFPSPPDLYYLFCLDALDIHPRALPWRSSSAVEPLVLLLQAAHPGLKQATAQRDSLLELPPPANINILFTYRFVFLSFKKGLHIRLSGLFESSR
jgi:hypothetical protein